MRSLEDREDRSESRRRMNGLFSFGVRPDRGSGVGFRRKGGPSFCLDERLLGGLRDEVH